ncbi:hypothetical protein IZ6_01200 [Terrihabitans soli]|uniref:Activator of Hsp90 ATPase homologue 1/2-like C-terminal domain-containing protein n=1 Tax=Terrihabitans soli TaxID=708113 RepID=A0A6S6QNK2_9HYPH|nr:SRPBCC domain-containing protein [Terrihabitans soli]BCJ89385.1 hypothetical protein IZ6_01200 [Terrihabitans soli]
MTAKPSLTIKKRLSAPVSLVYQAWTDPEMLMHWFGPDHCTVFHAEADVRVGGCFRVRMKATDGEIHDVSGTYIVVEPDARLEFTWAWITMPERESRVTVTLKADGDITILTLLHEQFADEAARAGHEYGWTQAFGKLERTLEARPA